MKTDSRIYKITVNLPERFLDDMMDRIDRVTDPVYPGYRRTFSYSKVTGTWMPVEGSDPFKGETGKIEVSEEIRLEFVVMGKDLKNVIAEMTDVHPYEEPAIDITPVLCRKDIV
ncbi:MAG: hypothetical protein FWD92_05105 [Methanomassiliicoccaceae archaeon]|nr:hypothetical protein [Methanomassiliicoccaceae archaeon]